MQMGISINLLVLNVSYGRGNRNSRVTGLKQRKCSARVPQALFRNR